MVRLILTFLLFGSLVLLGNSGVFASSLSSWSMIDLPPLFDENTDANLRAREEKKILVMQDINAYILDAYRAQWDKILRNLDMSLKKTMPKVKDQIAAYRRLKQTLIENKEHIQNIDISETRRELIVTFLNYFIGEVNIRIEGLIEK